MHVLPVLGVVPHRLGFNTALIGGEVFLVELDFDKKNERP